MNTALYRFKKNGKPCGSFLRIQFLCRNTHWNININAIIMILSIIFNIVLRRYWYLLTLLPFQILYLLHFIDLNTSCVYRRIVCVFYRIMCAYRIVRVSCVSYRVYRIVCVSYRVCVLYRVYIVLYHICIVSYVYSILCVSYLVEIRIIKFKAWTMWQCCFVFKVKNSRTGTCS